MKNGSSRHALPVALLLLVAVVHLGYDPIAALLAGDSTTDRAQLARAVYYVLRGFEGAAVWACLYCISPRSLPWLVACAWGATENAQAAVCRLALGLGGVPPAPGPFRGLCDIASGVDVSAMTAIAVLVAAAVVQESVRDGSG